MEAEKIINTIANYFVHISTCVAIVTGFKNRKGKSELRLLFLYPLISFLQVIIAGSISLFKFEELLEFTIIRFSIIAFIVGEFLLIYDFFAHVVNHPIVKRILIAIFKSYLFVCLFYAIVADRSQLHPSNLYIMQAFTMLLAAVLYFIDLFHRPSFPFLLRDPSFWVAIGVLFYFSCTLPLYLFPKFVFSSDGTTAEKGFYAINYFSYGILFLLITKAYRCKKTETQ